MAREKLIQLRQGTRAELNASTAHWYPGEPGYIEDERAFIVADRDGPTDEQNFAVFREPTRSLVDFHTSIFQPGTGAVYDLQVFPSSGTFPMSQLEPEDRLIIEGMFVFDGDDSTPKLNITNLSAPDSTLIPEGFSSLRPRNPAHLRLVVQHMDLAVSEGQEWATYVGQITQPGGSVIGLTGMTARGAGSIFQLVLSRTADPLDRPLQVTVHAWIEKGGQ